MSRPFMPQNFMTIPCIVEELKLFLDLTFFDPCDPGVKFEVTKCHNFCSQSPIDDCDQVWLKSDS